MSHEQNVEAIKAEEDLLFKALEKATASTDEMHMSIGFGDACVNIPGCDVQESLRLFWELIKVGQRPDRILIRNYTCEGVRTYNIR